jgi:histone H3
MVRKDLPPIYSKKARKGTRFDKSTRKTVSKDYYDNVKSQKNREESKKKKAKEIRKYQTSTKLLVPKRPFSRFVRSMTAGMKEASDIRYSSKSIILLQQTFETYLTKLFQDAYKVTKNDGRRALREKDVDLALELRGD